MRNFLFGFALIILLSSIPFAAVQWVSPSAAGITGKGILLAGNAIFTSYDGNTYALRAGAGPPPSWVYDAGAMIALEPVAVDGFTLAIAVSDGRVVFLNAVDRSVRAEYDFGSEPFALGSGNGNAYVGFNGSVVAISPSNKILWNASINGAPGQIGYGNGLVYFTAGGRLYALSATTGHAQWAGAAADSFLSRPAEGAGVAYIGGTDGRLYALNSANGKAIWSYLTMGGIQSTPAISDSGIFFGSSDGYLYALDTAGNLLWKFDSGSPIWSEPSLAGHQVVFGNNAGQLYGLDAITGAEIWSFSGEGRAYSPLYYPDRSTFIFGTSKGLIYSLSSSPICSFTAPTDGDAVGDWPVDVEGRAYSDSGIAKVELRVGEGEWVMATGAEGWFATVDFTGRQAGGYTLQCRATDVSGRSETGEYSSITLIKQDSLPLQRMYVSAPSSVAQHQNFSLYVTGSNGKNLRGVTVSVGGSKKSGDSPFSITLDSAGPVAVTAQKPGFADASTSVVAQSSGDLTVPIIIVLVLAAAAYFLVIKRFLQKKQ